MTWKDPNSDIIRTENEKHHLTLEDVEGLSIDDMARQLKETEKQIIDKWIKKNELTK